MWKELDRAKNCVREIDILSIYVITALTVIAWIIYWYVYVWRSI